MSKPDPGPGAQGFLDSKGTGSGQNQGLKGDGGRAAFFDRVKKDCDLFGKPFFLAALKPFLPRLPIQRVVQKLSISVMKNLFQFRVPSGGPLPRWQTDCHVFPDTANCLCNQGVLS